MKLRVFLCLAMLSPGALPAATSDSSKAGQFWRGHWYERGLEHANPAYESRFRVNSPEVVLHPVFGKRVEARENGLMLIRAEEDLSLLTGAELYLELWGGHPGTAGKRVTVNGRSTYHLPRVGTEEKHCTYHYPVVPLKIRDLVNGYNALQFAVDQGTTFWGHMLVDNACLRVALTNSHPDLVKARVAEFLATVTVEPSTTESETFEVGLNIVAGDRAQIAAVDFQGFYLGYDENGDTRTRDWHGFTKAREPVGILGTATEAPFALSWDTRMLPSQHNVAVRAVVHFKNLTNVVYITSPRNGLEIAARPDRQVTLYGSHDLPVGFWSRAGRQQECTIYLDVDPQRIESAELHVNAWTGGPGQVEEYFKLNGEHFPVADGTRHELVYSRLAVNPALLRHGVNRIELLSDTDHHGIEILLPGPCLMVRSKQETPITVTEVAHQGQESFQIVTTSATYFYHKRGAGFASLIDRDGHDWISYSPGGGSAGEYRGIPNCGVCFHPGYTNATSRIVRATARQVTILSETLDQGFAGTWEINSESATFTLTRASTNFWFLYEGTPGGKLDEDADFMGRSDGRRTPLSQVWSEDIPAPEWLYFADGKLDRSLVIIHHQDDSIVDQYWPMEGNMTVFGFGRKHKTIEKHLTQTPARFTIALRETRDFGEIQKFAEAVLQAEPSAR